ncbi:MAG: YdcH family protein [Beijerinckiaceae bacterium]
MHPPDNDDREDAHLEAELERLRQEHRDLDVAIAALQASALADQLQIQRLKKRKLVLRDKILQVENMLTPDIIA